MVGARTTLMQYVSFSVLSLTAVSLTSFCAVESYDHHILFTVLKVILLIGLLAQLFKEVRTDWDSSGRTVRKDLLTALSVIVGAVAAFFANIELGHGGVIGSSIVGITSAVVVPSYAVAMFCGSFIGMASPAVFASYPQLLLAAAVSAVIFVWAQDVFIGFGGKLGTTAFAGSIAAAFILDAPLVHLSIPPVRDMPLIIVFSIAGVLLTFWIHTTLKHDAVTASSLVGLLAGLTLPIFFGEDEGTTLAVIVFCASFAGMSTKDRIPNWLFLLAVGIVTGLMFIFSIPYIGGAGGKLGTVAFAALLSVTGLHGIIRKIRMKLL
jgi:hypothetical protein